MSDLIVRLTNQEIQAILIDHIAEAYCLDYDSDDDDGDGATCDVQIEVPAHSVNVQPFVRRAEIKFPNDRNFEEDPDDGVTRVW